MYNMKTIVTAASLAVLAAAGSASAAPWDHHAHGMMRRDAHFERRPIVVRERVYESIRLHHYRGVGAPVFLRGHYVVKSFNRFGQIVFVEVDPYTGAFLGEFRA